MGIRDLQAYLETHCESACLSVDLLKISRSYLPKRNGRMPGSGRFCLVVDAESCLDRLYGGYFSDWVCGGQWNRMVSFLSNLYQACESANMDMVVFFNGALESQKIDIWYASQLSQKKKINMVFRHMFNRGTPPPKVWWNPPVFLCGALRLALRQLGIGVAMSLDDHDQEVIAFCWERELQGILGHNAVYAVCDPPRYFSSQNLKLTYKGSLETKEYVIDEMAKSLDLNPNRFCLLAALLGGHILTEEDLYEFYKELLARASQDAGKTVKLIPDNVVRFVIDYVRSIPDISNMDIVGEGIFRNSKGNKTELIDKLKQSVQYYFNGTKEAFLRYKPGHMPGSFPLQMIPQNTHDYKGYGYPGMQNGSARAYWREAQSPDNGFQQFAKQGKGRSSGKDGELPQVSPEILHIARERHQKGMMSPWVYQVLSQGEIKMVLTLEDENYKEVPLSIDLYRPMRQTTYSLLLNLSKLKIQYENKNKDKVSAAGAASKSFDVTIKEWVVHCTGNPKPSFDLVVAKPVEWKTPSLERMWLGTEANDKTRRLRAFLTVMHADTPLMLNTNYVPQHLLILCCVLRYILEYGRILQRQELDAFLAMSVSPLLYDVQTMQDLKLPSVQPRGVSLAALFMAGVEVAQFANDVCGAPVPWNMVCPWQYFDGKLFHFKLLKANNNTPLIDLCDGQVEQVLRVEQMRQAIFENLKFEFARPFLPTQAPYPCYSMPYDQGFGGPFLYRPAGMGRMPPQGPPDGRAMGFMDPMMTPEMGNALPARGNGILGRSPVDGRGGQLEIAGVVVGSWGPNLSVSSRGRGGGNNGVRPRVMSEGAARRGGGGGRGMIGWGGSMNNRPMRGGRSMPMSMYRMPEYPFYGRMARGMPRGAVHGTKRPVIRARPKPLGKKVGKGRGMTVDIQSENPIINISDLEENDNNDNYVDAEEDEEEEQEQSNESGAILKNLVQSPDSGIFGDGSPSAIDSSS